MANGIGNASDTQLVAIALQCWTQLDALPTAYPGVTTLMIDGLDDARGVFSSDVTAHVAAQAAAKAKTQAKYDSRAALETVLRDIRNVAKANHASEAAMANLGIPAPEGGAPASATVPAVAVDTSERLRHTVSWTDAGTPNNKRKPIGTLGAEIWVKIDGPPPGNESDCVFLTLDAFTPYVSEYDAANGGKTAHYMVRWRMKDGSVGAFGETVSATITA